MTKVSPNHPWKNRKKVKAECLTCGKVYDRDPASATKTCSDKCYRQYAKAKHMMHQVKGGFR